jgi:hypothetical protein
MRRLVIALAVLAAAPATASAQHTIEVEGRAVTRMGPFQPRQDPTIGGAVAAFGATTSRRSLGAGECMVRWRPLRLRILFANYGEPGANPCANRIGLASSFTVMGRAFRTGKGLQVDDRVRRLRELYPRAKRRRGTYWLRTARFLGVGDRFPVLSATAAGGRVKALKGYIGAAGD